MATNLANATEESKNSDIDFSGVVVGANHSHTIDQLMFRSHETGRAESSQARPQIISMLAEDVQSFAKVNSENLVD